ncbi:hypothetical protein NM208_g11634 [Fusarium decemcellulare]|uniref:Uncharacterized protein n=1 Tax=Fusarium decemcellulare TaxID=57161 RepID=A0ACC1RUI7_9HYPO|nr:hypothetical protein NM208_g11634 [Fusarium decemcellulare]
MMLSKEARSGLIQAQNAEEFTDLTFICGQRKIHVQKLIICIQSPVFRAACLGHFQETSSGTYDLDAPSLVLARRMIDYVYTEDYSEMISDDGGDDTEEEIPPLSPHTATLALTDKYDIKEPRVLAAKK